MLSRFAPPRRPARPWAARRSIGAVLIYTLWATAGAVVPAGSDPGGTAPPTPAAISPAELAVAAPVARTAFAAHCSACHGAHGEGRRDKGAPNLVDTVWVWDDATADNPVAALEDTIRFGIRSGHPRARNIATMPAFGHGGEMALSADEIADVVTYVASLSGATVDPAARRRGRAIYAGRANCIECHSGDGTGNADWGAPDLTVPEDKAWLYGRDRVSVTTTIRDGRAGHCPAWIDRIDAATIHALAVWLRSGHAAPSP